MYAVKELFLTLQGEGVQAGRRAVFVRFSGCNLWSGREVDRATARCSFCDTDFFGTDGDGGGDFAAPNDLVTAVLDAWGGEAAPAFVVFTGGEPLLQLDPPLIAALKARGVTIAVETNGTLVAPEGIDWLCVSPKAGTPLVQRSGDEMKLVWPQAIDPETLLGLQFNYWRLQPMDGPAYKANLEQTIQYCLEHPPWQASLQQHKIWGVR